MDINQTNNQEFIVLTQKLMEDFMGKKIANKQIEWFLSLSFQERDALMERHLLEKFELFRALGEFRVPDTFSPKEDFRDFLKRKKEEGSLTDYQSDINSKEAKELLNPTDKVISGEILEIFLYRPRKQVSSMDCLDFLKKKGFLFLGALGQVLISERWKDLPSGYLCVSYDGASHLPPRKDNYRFGMGGDRMLFHYARGMDTIEYSILSIRPFLWSLRPEVNLIICFRRVT